MTRMPGIPRLPVRTLQKRRIGWPIDGCDPEFGNQARRQWYGAPINAFKPAPFGAPGHQYAISLQIPDQEARDLHRASTSDSQNLDKQSEPFILGITSCHHRADLIVSQNAINTRDMR